MNRVAIFIDGGFYLKRRFPDEETWDADTIMKSIQTLIYRHLERLATEHPIDVFDPDYKGATPATQDPSVRHFRTFYYDAPPLARIVPSPVSKQPQDLRQKNAYKAKNELLRQLRRTRSIAVRLGKLSHGKEPWEIKPKSLEKLVNGKKAPSDIDDSDYKLSTRQKGVDMRMGIDISAIALKKQADTFILVTGDSDFVPATKLVRREGCRVILDSLQNNISDELYEHIDELAADFWQGHRKK